MAEQWGDRIATVADVLAVPLDPPAVREMQAPADRPLMSPPRYPEQAFRAGARDVRR